MYWAFTGRTRGFLLIVVVALSERIPSICLTDRDPGRRQVEGDRAGLVGTDLADCAASRLRLGSERWSAALIPHVIATLE
jgi:hypothetical protein